MTLLHSPPNPRLVFWGAQLTHTTATSKHHRAAVHMYQSIDPILGSRSGSDTVQRVQRKEGGHVALAHSHNEIQPTAQIALLVGSRSGECCEQKHGEGAAVGPVDESPNPRLGRVPRALGVLGAAEWTGLTPHTTSLHRRQEAARAYPTLLAGVALLLDRDRPPDPVGTAAAEDTRRPTTADANGSFLLYQTNAHTNHRQGRSKPWATPSRRPSGCVPWACVSCGCWCV